ncbi:MAG: hypothetical protein G3I10_03095 [Ferrovum sp.]|nr:hypothetical protein [Ferrovum sp.]
MDALDEGKEVSSMSVESGTVALLNKSEIDMQVATAHKYPRSIKRFRDESLQMVTLSESVAESCIYALPRDGKVIEGPSARFAEVVASAWGNCRAGARVVSDQGEFITAQGVFHDLERNVAITFEVQRRITDKHGRRYKPDMVGVTGNAASSIALRNAILKGIPKAFWDDMYQAARKTVMGDFKTLANRRADALKAFLGYGVSQEQVFAKLGVAGIEDVGLEHLVTLRGLLTAIKEGDTTPDQAFAPDAGPEIGMPAAKKSDKEPPADQAAQAKTTDQKPDAAQKEENTNAASKGERAYLAGKCETMGVALADVAQEAGITDLENLTKDGFIAIKELLAQKERAA